MESPDGRSIVREDADGLQVVIPAQKNWVAIVFLCAWLGGWFFGEITALGQITKAGPASSFLFFWLAGWTVGGLAAALAVLWQLVGKEQVDVSGGVLTIQRRIASAGISQQYDLTRVKNFRLTPVQENSTGWANRTSAVQYSGRITFDYGLKTRKFGMGLDDAEAAYLLDLFKTRI